MVFLCLYFWITVKTCTGNDHYCEILGPVEQQFLWIWTSPTFPKRFSGEVSFLHWQLELSVYSYKEPDSWSMITMKNQSMQVFWWLHQRYSNPVLYHKRLTQCTSFPRTFTICKSSSWNEKTDIHEFSLGLLYYKNLLLIANHKGCIIICI